ncbi:MAG: hypothetical protein ACE37H_13135 [Phycisphaeraceae bacterium]
MKRPIEVTPICLILIAAAIIGVFTYGPERGWAIACTAIFSSGIVLLVTLGFWCGDRFCHRLLAFFAIWAMIRPVMLVLMEPPFFDKVVMLAEAGLALPLLIWLFSPRIDAFTRQEQQPPALSEHEA